MAYQIHYTPESDHRYPQRAKRTPIKWGRVAVAALLFVSALWLRLNGIPDFLIPGDPEITKTAANQMIHEIQSGTSLDDAVTTFCKQIINGAVS